MKKLLLLGGGIGLAIVVVSGLLVGVALAADPPGTNTNGTDFSTRVAKILGIPDQKLKDAVKQAEKDIVSEALKAGKLTQDQANSLNDRIDKNGGTLRGPDMGGRMGPMTGKGLPGMMGGRFGLGSEIQAVADLLKMTSADIQTQLRSGKTLAQIGAEKNVSKDQMKTAILNAMQKQLDQAVANGKLTKDQADKLKTNASSMIDKMLDQTMTRPQTQPRQQKAPSQGQS